MAIAVIVIVQWYSIHVLGFRGYLRRFTKPFELPLLGRIFFTPLNIIEEIAKPLSLALRLFGNIFGGLVMVYLLTLGFTAFAGSSVIQTALSPIWVILLVGLEALRCLPHRHDPGIHLHASDDHLFRYGP